MTPRRTDDRPQLAFHTSAKLPDPVFYSHSVTLNQASNLVLTSGILGQNADGSFPEAVEDQSKVALDNLKAVLNNSGVHPGDVIKVTFYVKDYDAEAEKNRAIFANFQHFATEYEGAVHHPLTTLIPVTQLAVPEAKIEIEMIAAVGGHTSIYAGPIERATAQPRPQRKVDVVVVGGGFSGIQAAWDCQRAGLSFVVLEAKHRIGGRSRTHQLKSGPGVVELGATWINRTTQPTVYATAKRLGLETSEQYVEGDILMQLQDGTVMRIKPDSPEAQAMEQSLKDMAELVEDATQKVNLEHPEQFPTKLDVSLETWAEANGLTAEMDKQSFRLFVLALLGREPREMGMHYALDYIKSGLGVMSLALDTAEGAQHLKIKKGTTSIVQGLADELLPGSILLNAPVDAITQTTEGTVVQTATGIEVSCKKVIVAIPTNTYGLIKFSPPIPSDKRHLVSRTKPGIYQKMILTYRNAWWKDMGFSGKIESFKGPINFSFDVSNADLQQYSLALFIVGDTAAEWMKLNELQREEALIEHLAEVVGPEHAHLARDVLESNYCDWSAEDYLFGAPTSVMGPELLSRYGKALREPFQHVHFAGAEMAFEWKGYLEGALTAGTSAAKAVMASIAQSPPTVINGSH